MSQAKICIVLGTRPEVIKVSPVLRLLEERGVDHFVIHSNQHYSENMDRIFFEELNLAPPRYNLGVGSAEHGNQTGKMMAAIETIVLTEKPSVLLAQGDTNTVLAGILTGAKQNIPCGHIEAGLRSYDRRMPEEKNRIICDVISDYLFCPTEVQRKILLDEGIDDSKIHVTGNTIVDAVYGARDIVEKRSTVLQRLNLSKGSYVLVTAHRASNTDYPGALEQLVRVIEALSRLADAPVVYPIHPRTASRLKQEGLTIRGATLIDPVGYADFLALQMNAKLVVTDSGGVQEETCILGVPCITIRENTERPETITVGANQLVGLDIDLLTRAVPEMLSRPTTWENPFGDGRAAERILEVVCRA